VDPVSAALLGALIGAVAGLAGGALAAIASLRASQVAARAPLAPKLHNIAAELIRLAPAIGQADEIGKRHAFELAWNDFAVHQKILCPSRRIESMVSLVRATQRGKASSDETANAHLALAGQVLDKLTRMVGAHSAHLFRFRAALAEDRILEEWLNSDESRIMSPELRRRISELNRGGP